MHAITRTRSGWHKVGCWLWLGCRLPNDLLICPGPRAQGPGPAQHLRQGAAASGIQRR